MEKEGGKRSEGEEGCTTIATLRVRGRYCCATSRLPAATAAADHIRCATTADGSLCCLCVLARSLRRNLLLLLQLALQFFAHFRGEGRVRIELFLQRLYHARQLRHWRGDRRHHCMRGGGQCCRRGGGCPPDEDSFAPSPPPIPLTMHGSKSLGMGSMARLAMKSRVASS